MKDPAVFIQNGTLKEPVPSMKPYFISPPFGGNVISAEFMRVQDAVTCRWLGYGYQKGITNPEKNISVVAVGETMCKGLHASLAQDLEDIDPLPLCYEDNHKKGFGSFVRWVYFADPLGKKNYFGVDWSLIARPTSGIANSMLSVAKVVLAAYRHGLPEGIEVVLLNGLMQEELVICELRNQLQLVKVKDWVTNAMGLFGPASNYCPRCGLKSLTFATKFCSACGCSPQLIWKESGLF